MNNQINAGDTMSQCNTNELTEVTTLTDNTRIVGQKDGNTNTNLGWFSLSRLKNAILISAIHSFYSTFIQNGKLACCSNSASEFDNAQTNSSNAFVSKGTLNNLMADRWSHDFDYKAYTPAGGAASVSFSRRRGFAYIPTTADVAIDVNTSNTGDNRVLVENEGASPINVTFTINGSSPTHSERISQIQPNSSALYEIIAIDKITTLIQHAPLS